MDVKHRQLTLWIGAVLLGLLTFLVFSPVQHQDFVNLDDPDYVTQNPHVLKGLTAQNVAWAFTHSHAANWHPLTWISHMADVELFGLNPGPHKLVNVAFHSCNAVLLFFLILKMLQLSGVFETIKPGRLLTIILAFLAAALFATHPLRVESVAWISERKDVLSGFFFLLTLLAYLGYAAPAGRRRLVFYFLSLLMFACGLMSKPMLVTTPFILLLLDYWPLNRILSNSPAPQSLRTILLEKIPFFALSLASSLATIIIQNKAGGVASFEGLPLGFRLSNGLIAYISYIAKFLAPMDLAVLYPYPNSLSILRVAFCGFVLLATTYLLMGSGKAGRIALVGWLWFLGMLVPVIGIVHAGAQSMADRYTYLPSIGVTLVLLCLVCFLVEKWPGTRAVLLVIPAVLTLGLLPFLTTKQLQTWQDSESLFRHALAVTERNLIAHYALGQELVSKGKLDEAAEQFSLALAISPEDAKSAAGYASVLALNGQPDQALDLYNRVLSVAPNTPGIRYRIGGIYLSTGRRAEAIDMYKAELALNPDNIAALNDLAWILSTSPDPKYRNGEEAVRSAARACDLSAGREPFLLGTLAAAFAESGRFAEAIGTAQRAINRAEALGLTAVAQKNRELLELYRAGKPYREDN